MILPYLSEVQNASKKYSVVFRGINYGEGTKDGEFAETYNLSTDQYPCITQRAERIKATDKYSEPSTLHSKGDLLVIDGEDVWYGDTKVGSVEKGKKQTATIGNYIVIFPDKKYYKVPTEEDKDGEFGSMEIEFKRRGFLSFSKSEITLDKLPFLVDDEVTISGCAKTENNKEEKIIVKGVTTSSLTFDENTFIEATENGEVTIKRDSIEVSYSQVLFNGKQITIYNSTCPFKTGDAITISGVPGSGNSASNNRGPLVITGIGNDGSNSVITFGNMEIDFFNGGWYYNITLTRAGEEYKVTGTSFNSSSISLAPLTFKKGDAVTITGCSENGNNKEEGKEVIIKSATSDTLTFDDNTFTEATESGEITIKRSVPDLDFICESNYRLWGTHENSIYSSKFSDPFNFKVFEHLSTDSYSIEVGSEGDFTGCIPYSSHICFFKENTLHKLYGTKPSNFQITTVNVYGVQSGCERSMQIVNEQLLYKGVGGIYAYTGGVPELISEKFGNKRYSDAVACCDGEKYYISMKQGDTWNMFAYDVLKNIWLREDDTHAVDMTFYKGKVYFLDDKGGLYYIDKDADRNNIEWGATFCTMHETINERKGYSKFHLRMDLSAGAWLAVDIKTDNDTQWRQVYTTHNEKAKTFNIPIIPTRCDSIDIRLRGKGSCTIRAFIREFTTGSDV